MGENLASGQAFYHLYKTLLRVGFGLILTMVLGIAVGTIMGLSRTGEVFLDSWVMVGIVALRGVEHAAKRAGTLGLG